MPCLIITGHPSCGKTTIANTIRDCVLSNREKYQIDDVIIINEESEYGTSVSKQVLYENSTKEKETRGTLKSAFDRTVGSGGANNGAETTTTTTTSNSNLTNNKRRLIILDSMNYIKGFRYELHCISKAAGEIHGILWVLNKVGVVNEWNAKKNEHTAVAAGSEYSSELLQELISRYEPPDERNRWDKPLFTIDVAPNQTATLDEDVSQQQDGGTKTEVLKQSVYNMHNLGDALGETTTLSSPGDESQSQQQQRQTPVPKKSAFKRAPKKSAFQRKPKTNPNPQHAGIVSETPATLVSPSMLACDDPNDIQQAESKVQAGYSNPNTTAIPTPSASTTKVLTLKEQIGEILNIFLLQTKALKEGTSTRQNIAGQANVLQDLDSISAKVISLIAIASSQQQQSITNSALLLSLPGSTKTLSIKCQRPVALPELRRLRKMYLQWAVSHPPEDTTQDGIAKSFLAYIEDQL